MTDVIVAKFNPDQKRDPDGEFADGIPGPAADPLKLAGRIKLGPGETFGGSAVVDDGNGDTSTVLARVDGRNGTHIRIGVVNPEDKRRWAAEPKGRTVELDAKGAAALQDAVRRGIDKGKNSVTEYRAELREAIKAGKPESQWPDTDADIAKGVVRGSRWGDVEWTFTREEGGDYITVAGEEAISADVLFSLAPRASVGSATGGPDFGTRSPRAMKKLDKAISDLLDGGQVAAAARSTPRGGPMAELLGVELVRPGTWHLSSGPREFTPAMLRDAADFYAASGGQQIPLGFGHQDRRFDGDPAFGWLSNVRYDEDDHGPVLLGDLVELDQWVAAAAPARWPHRSIEGVAGITFKGREYALALTRLALLGSTPPGIPVLKSLSDLRQLVSAAAAASGAEWIAASTEASPQGADPKPSKEGAGMNSLAKYREVLAGLPDGSSEDEVTAALAAAGLVASQTEPPKPAPNPTPPPAPAPADPAVDKQLVNASAAGTPGMRLVSESVWEETQNTIKRLSSFVDETKRNERDTVIASAVEQGKFTPAQKKHFADLWDGNPDGVRDLIEKLTPNTALAIAASGYADLDDSEFSQEFAGLFPPSSNGGRRG